MDTDKSNRQPGQDVHIGLAISCIYNPSYTTNEQQHGIQNACRIVFPRGIKVACSTSYGGGRAAASARLPSGTTAAAAPAAPGTSGIAVPASAPTGPPPAASPPPESKRARNFVRNSRNTRSDQVQPTRQVTCRQRRAVNGSAWLMILPRAGSGPCQASGRADEGGPAGVACRQGCPTGKPGA